MKIIQTIVHKKDFLKIIKRSGHTVQTLADRMEVSRAYLYQLINEQKNISEDNWKKIAKILNKK